MLEIPESITLASQLNMYVKGKEITKVVVNQNPNKFAFFYEEPNNYENLLSGKTIGKADSIGGMIEISLGEVRLVVGDGTNIRYCESESKVPKKHQLQLIFTDRTSLVFYVLMYGIIWAFKEGAFENPYYYAAKTKVSILNKEFDENYFFDLMKSTKPMSVKSFLATEQRIPGLGNGILQDILWNAKIHPKRKTDALSKDEKKYLFQSIKATVQDMVAGGGRDIEKDLLGNTGKYTTILSKNTVASPCKRCGGRIVKESYMGGSIYFCQECQ